MRRIHPRRVLALGALAAVLALTGAGGKKSRKPHLDPQKPLKVDETIGNIAVIASAGEIPVEGVGLVVGLDNTGSDPEPSYYRQKLVDQMRKAGIDDADKLLKAQGPTLSLVIVRAKIPAGVGPEDKFDATLELTPLSETKSLANGYLLPVRLTELLIGQKGEAHEGHVLAVAAGPVMTGSAKKPDDPKVGRVLGGCRAKKDMPHGLIIDKNHRSIRTAGLVEGVINQRFHQHEGVDEKGLATAKTDEYLTLKVPKVYHQNQQRFFQVVKYLPIIDNPTLRERRLEKWTKELLDPKTAGIAALRLEGFGPSAVDALKKGLANDNPQVKYFAAEALAYLDDSSGVDVLAEAAVNRPEFRAFALTALAALDQAASALRLRKLMDNPDFEIRYGAFNALKNQNPDDPFLGRVPLFDEPPPPAEDGEPLEYQIATPRRRATRPADPFELYLVDTDGPPMVHISRNQRCEIVVFGKDQKMLTPVVLGSGGAILLNAADGDETIQISRIEQRRLDGPEQRIHSPRNLGEVIRNTAQLGATYPEMVRILMAAHAQRNLPGPLAIDKTPVPDPKYDAAQLVGIDPTAKKDTAVQKAKAEAPKRRRLIDALFRSRDLH
jgi:flagellar basal body P-ring protein FlgI